MAKASSSAQTPFKLDNLDGEAYPEIREGATSFSTGGRKLEAIDWARKAVAVASEKQATDIVMLDLRGLCSFTDYFVILSAETQRQLDSLSEEIEKVLEEEGATLRHREGTPDSGWILLDFGDVIVHLFSPEQRDYYRLEQVWSAGFPVLRVQ